MTHFDRPTISIETELAADTQAQFGFIVGEEYHRAIFNIPHGARIFGPWMRSVNAAFYALARAMSEHPSCALALMPLVVTGEWKAEPSKGEVFADLDRRSGGVGNITTPCRAPRPLNSGDRVKQLFTGRKGTVRDASWREGAQVAWDDLLLADSDAYIYPFDHLVSIPSEPDPRTLPVKGDTFAERVANFAAEEGWK